jgi:hypothetical protein
VSDPAKSLELSTIAVTSDSPSAAVIENHLSIFGNINPQQAIEFYGALLFG